MPEPTSSVAKLLSLRSFQKNPVATTYRAVAWILFHTLPKRHALIEIPVNGTSFKLDLPPLARQGGSAGIFLQRQYYEPLLEFCHQLVKPGNVVFDVGANQGIYACAFAALVGSSGRVVAFEPQDYAITALRNNVRLNKFDQITVQQAAVSDREGSAVLDVSHGAVSASIVRDFGGRNDAATVPTVTLAAVAERLGIDKIDVIKMDIEGAELLALKGGEALLKQYKPTVVLEATPDDIASNWFEIVDLLTDLGYEAYLFGPDGRLERIADLNRWYQHYPNVVFIASCP
jgi:FkbM family methyltransferase